MLETFRRAAAAAPPDERLQAIARAYTDELLPDRRAVLMSMQGFAAVGVDPEIRATVRQRFGDMVIEVGGVGPGDVRAFFANRMLLNIMAALDRQGDGRPHLRPSRQRRPAALGYGTAAGVTDPVSDEATPVHQTEDACIRKAASAHAARPPRSPWTISESLEAQ